MPIRAQNIDGLNPVAQLPVTVNLGTLTASAAGVFKIALPFTARIRRVDLFVGGAVSGTTPSLEVTVAGATSGASVTTAAVTAETPNPVVNEENTPLATGGEVMEISTTLSGTTPSFADVWVTVWLQLTNLLDVGGTDAQTAY